MTTTLSLAPMTELEAVNYMLGAIGDSPVNSLDDLNLAQASLARTELHNMSRQVQSKGWQFNSEHEVLNAPDNNGNINLGQNVLKVKQTFRDDSCEVTQRGLKLYNRTDSTFTFTQSIYLDWVLFLDWDDLPSTARDYISIAAARKFQRGYIGSKELNEITQEDEFKALAALKEAEGESLEGDILTNVWPFTMLATRRVI